MNRLRPYRRWLAVLTAGIALLPQLRGESEPDNKPPEYRMRMLWLPQAEFAGFYVAQADRLYEKHGIRIRLDHANTSEDLLESLREDRTDIIVNWLIPALADAAKGGDIVNFGQLHQSSSLMLITLKENGIKKVEDLENRRIGFWVANSLRIPVKTYLRHHGVTRFREYPVLTSVDLLLYRGIDATVGMKYDEYYRLYMAGFDHTELQTFALQDAFPELVDDGLYCKGSRYRKNPAHFRAIRQATLAGWQRAFADKERTLRLIQNICETNNIPFNSAHQRWMLNVMEKLMNFPENSGILREASFQQTIKLLELEKANVEFSTFSPETPK